MILIIGHHDGHGTICTALSKIYIQEKYKTTTSIYIKHKKVINQNEIINYDGTNKPEIFWQYGLVNITKNYTDLSKIVTVDIPPPTGMGPKFKQIILNNPKLVVIDHHEFVRLFNIPRYVFTTAMKCYYGSWDNSFHSREEIHKLARIGAICDRDPSVLPVSAEEEILALKIDAAIRSKGSILVANAIVENQLKEILHNVSIKPVSSVYPDEIGDNYIIATRLTEGWAHKQLDYLLDKYNKVYGIGVFKNEFNNKHYYIIVKHWKKTKCQRVIDFINKLKNPDTGQNFKDYYGHPDAITIRCNKPLKLEDIIEIIPTCK